MNKYYDELQKTLKEEGIAFDNTLDSHSKCLMTSTQANKTLETMKERLNSNHILLGYVDARNNDLDYHYYIFWCDKLEEIFNGENGYIKAKELAKIHYNL